jgi:integrase
MPRRAKGPRLWLQPARRDAKGKVTESAVWCIRDGGTKLSTGVGPGEDQGPPVPAQNALRDYLVQKSTPRPRDRDPSEVEIATVIAIYIEDVAPRHARPDATSDRLEQILKHFAGKTLDYLNMTTCGEYVKARGKQAAARRELEDLRAAVRHHWKSGLCTSLVPVVLPDKGEARERWLTRDEAAELLWTAWRLRQTFRGKPTEWERAKHLAHFILVGLYTGTRAGAICGAALAPEVGRGWVDTENGVFYRRAIGKAKTKKRQPSVRVPPRLLAHIRRWKRLKLIRHSLIEWQGEPVKRVNKGFAAVVKEAKLKDVSPHILRHTAITWQAQLGVPPHEICGFFGITMKVFEEVYGHHHPDFQSNAVNAFNRTRQLPDRMNATKREQPTAKVLKIGGNS